MTQRTNEPGPVLAGLVGTTGAEAVLRAAFAEADRRAVALRVLLTGHAGETDDRFLLDLLARWAEKYPGVPVTTSVRRGIDAAVTLTAASRRCALAVVPDATTADPRAATALRAFGRRAHCPLVAVAAPA